MHLLLLLHHHHRSSRLLPLPTSLKLTSQPLHAFLFKAAASPSYTSCFITVITVICSHHNHPPRDLPLQDCHHSHLQLTSGREQLEKTATASSRRKQRNPLPPLHFSSSVSSSELPRRSCFPATVPAFLEPVFFPSYSANFLVKLLRDRDPRGMASRVHADERIPPVS